MKCPGCSYDKTSVIESRPTANNDAIRRRRKCDRCGQRFTTYERIDCPVSLVRKKDGRRETFKREKLLQGMVLACDKLPVTLEMLEQAADRIEAQVKAGGEMSTELLGELVMTELKGLHKVAYVRFAAVYREFKDLEDFAEAIRSAQHDDEGSGNDHD